VALATSQVRGIVKRACARQDVLDACARRDLGTAITVLGAHGLTQDRIAGLTGITQGRLSEWHGASGSRAHRRPSSRSPTAWACRPRRARRSGSPPHIR
jgi:hypothetical protein